MSAVQTPFRMWWSVMCVGSFSMLMSSVQVHLKSLSFSALISIPKMAANAETMSALSCSASCVAVMLMRSSANAFSVLGLVDCIPFVQNSPVLIEESAVSRMSMKAAQLVGEPTSPCPVPRSQSKKEGSGLLLSLLQQNPSYLRSSHAFLARGDRTTVFPLVSR